jgi:hypothetical protein
MIGYSHDYDFEYRCTEYHIGQDGLQEWRNIFFSGTAEDKRT